MPARIEHIWKNGQKLKWCSECKRFLLLKDFHTTGNQTWDGLYYLCVECINRRRRNNPRRLALNVWGSMCRRINEKPNYAKRKIQVRITKEAFVGWYVQNWFPRCRVDRIDNEGHYELSNIQLLTQDERNAKARQDRLDFLGVTEPNGMRWCYTCQSMKLNEEFYLKKRSVSLGNPLGLDHLCKDCSRKKRMECYHKHKGGR